MGFVDILNVYGYQRLKNPAWFEGFFKSDRCLFLKTRKHMSIDIHGDRYRGMSESFADDLRTGASAEHQTGMRVAQVVEPDIR